MKPNEAETVPVSNMQPGSPDGHHARGPADHPGREREACAFQALTAPSDHHVFINDEYPYGVRARVNECFGLSHLAFGPAAALSAENYAAARAAMMDFRADGGDVLGIAPNLLIVPPALEAATLHLLNTETRDGGGSNPWKGAAELVVTPCVSG